MLLIDQISEIKKWHDPSKPFVIAIDGRCGSGKSTLAADIAREFSCPVVHMDDFYLRPEQRTAERYATPGGNSDRERFTEEVLEPLKSGNPFSYRAYDFHSLSYSQPIFVQPCPSLVIEGTYACHPDLKKYYDLSIFLTVSPGEQMRRITLRSGKEIAKVFSERWIPLEEKYFLNFDIKDRCDFCYDTEQQILL